MLNISEEAIAITKRFFLAIDVLITQRKIRGLNFIRTKIQYQLLELVHIKKRTRKESSKSRIHFILSERF